MAVTATKVRFLDRNLWWLKREELGLEGPLAPPEHCDENGELTDEAVIRGDSFAHVGADGVVRRYRQEVGTVKDFVEGWS